MIIRTSSLSKSFVFKMFCTHTKNAKPPFLNSTSLKGVLAVLSIRFEVGGYLGTAPARVI